MKNFTFVTISSLAILLAACSATHQTEQQQENNQSQVTGISIEGAAAHWVSSGRLIWDAGEEAGQFYLYYSQDADLQVTGSEVSGGESIALSPDADLSDELADKFRHISDRPVFSLSTDRDRIHEALKGQIIAVAKDEDGLPLRATQVQIHGVIDDLFIFDGGLGPVYGGDSIRLNLWAPTAQSVTLHLYDDEKNLAEEIEPADTSPRDGVWRFEGPADWDRKFYRFDVRVYHHETGEIHNFKVTDPYSTSLATDSEFSQFVDVTSDDLKPEGWNDLVKTLPEHTDITLYEAHMRDFSIIDQTVPEEHRGTYMAFTHNGKNGRDLSDGMAHLQRLSDAGLTHLHLLPINDIASIFESRDLRVDLDDPYSRICEIVKVEGLQENCDQYGDTPIWEVFEQMADEDPITKEIQRTYAERGETSVNFSRHDGFNWGYDPYHFNVPQGSYSTDPNGTQRILETREMVKSLYEIGLNIVVDVVYNHTHATGDSRYSVLDKVVPGYYQRLNPDTGEVERSTCCPNTAAEFAMMERLILDSVIFWAKHYKIDSFRFDLMGHHPKYVMENLLDALAELTPEEHGVDGSKIYIYGEGWNFGEVADNRIFDQATQFMMGGTGIGNFNDRIRDAIRGGFFEGSGRDQGFANGRYLFPNEVAGDSDEEKETLFSHADRIRVGMTGNLSTYSYINRFGEHVDGSNEMIGYALNPQESVNYIDKHDNETLWDNTQAKLPFDLGMDERVRIHMLSNAFINYGQGIPFYQLGTDLLRSKSMDRNSYVSGDWFNAVDYTMETHNWAIGLPPEWDNAEQWEDHEEFMSNPNISVEKEHMESAHRQFVEQLEIRYSSPLFRLRDAGQVHTRVGYHNTGADQVPGIIAMTISDGRCAGESLDESLDGILVIFNADMQQHEIGLGISGLELHHIQQNGVDEVIRTAAETDGVFTVPSLSAAVFVKPQSGGQGDFPCNPAME